MVDEESAWRGADIGALADSERVKDEVSRLLGLEADPVTNIEALLTLIATGKIDPYVASLFVMGVSMDLHDAALCDELYAMWAELSDLFEFMAENSDGERAVLDAMRAAALEWVQLEDRTPAGLREYFERWLHRRDLRGWRPQLGGPTFDAIDERGWFRWDDRGES